jgi:hypothetical protein
LEIIKQALQLFRVVAVVADSAIVETQLLSSAEWHCDQVRPVLGSLVYRIPAWDVLEHLRAADFAQARSRHIASWKYCILGSGLLGVLVIKAWR